MKKIPLRISKKPILRKGVFGALLVLIFLTSMYGFKCLVFKVCEVIFIERFVRHDVLITMPRGAITAEVVDTKASRELGLSGRTSMNDNEGMLFVFDKPGRYGFWMKDMIFPLDIIWINQNGIVVEIERDLTPGSYPKTFINTSPASYVLEINAGSSEKEGLYIGSKVKIME
jgi:uncharacterized membrane protein (UPF0127 family)